MENSNTRPATLRHDQIDMGNGGVLMSAAIQSAMPSVWRDISSPGLTLGLVRGDMAFSLASRSQIALRGSLAFALASPEAVETFHHIQRPERLDVLFIHLPPETLDEVAATCPELASPRFAASPELQFQSWTPGHELVALSRRAALCPFAGTLRDIYLQGQSLEMLSSMVAKLADRRPPDARPLRPADIERLHRARDLLTENIVSPPSLASLARMTGTNVSALTAGFRRLFGITVVDHIQQCRLDTAMDLLREGRLTVAQVAFEIGYTPAYFATVFRRRFNCSPSELRSGTS